MLRNIVIHNIPWIFRSQIKYLSDRYTHTLFLELLFLFNSLNVFATIRYWPYMTDNSLMQLRYL